MQSFTDNANGDVTLIVKNVWYMFFWKEKQSWSIAFFITKYFYWASCFKISFYYGNVNQMSKLTRDHRSFTERQTSGTSTDNEWQPVVQRVTTNDNECYK